MLWCSGGVFVSTPAYADGYVDGTGNNIYYGYKTDASYSEARFHIEVDYYDTLQHAKDGKDEGKDPLGKFVRVHYLSNCNKDGGTADEWRFRPMWWFGVPAGLKEPQYIHFKRIEKLTDKGNTQVKPAGSSQYVDTDKNGYGVVSDRYYATAKEWNGISNFYLSDSNKINSEAWKKFVGVNGGQYDDTGKTKDKWTTYQQDSSGLKSIFVDWESAGTRYYDMTYVAEMTQDAWEKRDEHPLRFAAGVYRFAGNWHYAAGQKHNTPKIADHLTLKYPDVTLVKDLTNLTKDEKGKVQKAIEEANESKDLTNPNLFDKLLKEDGGIAVNNDGSAIITFKDKTTRKIPANILVAKGESDSDKYKPKMPERTPVVKPSKLTDEDKKTVLAAFKKANPDSSEFSKHLAKDNAIAFDKDGNNLVVTYKDGSKLEISASELVYQGATIADWAPYVVPDTIEVDDLKKLSDGDITKIKNAFDAANQGITPYDESKTKNGNNAPVEVNKTTGDVTITWKDGSTTVIDAWQFLKEKAKTSEPSTPTQQAEKTFIVESSDKPIVVTFDPFKTTSEEITTAGNVNTQLEGLKSTLKKLKGKDSKDNSDVTITDVEYSVENGIGYITFKAEGYKSAKYPMSAFFKQNSNNKVLPQTGTTTTSNTNKKGYKWNYTKFKIQGTTPTPAEKNAAVKQFVRDNYDGQVNDCSNGKYVLNQGLTPKTGSTSGLTLNGNSGLSYVQASDTDIKVYDKSGNAVITISDPYEKNQGQAGGADTTIADLKAQAKALLQQKRDTDKLSNNDLERAGIANADQLNDSKIDSMNDEKELRKLIRQLTDAAKAVYKYNTNPLEIENDPNDSGFGPNDNQFKDAVKNFLKANYDDTNSNNKIDNIEISNNSLTLDSKGWTPKTGTSDMELKSTSAPYGISSLAMGDDGKSLVFKNGETTLFTVSKEQLFKKKTESKPSGDKDKLPEMKKKAKEAIERNPNLTPEDKKKFKKQVDDAHDANGVNTALNNANAKAKENKNNTSDPSIQRQINNNKQGTTAQQQADEDKKKKDKEERDKKQEQQLQDDKKKASEQIENLTNLTPDEKKKLKEQINGDSSPANPNGATTPEAVKKILEKAKAINDANGALQNDIKKGALPFLDHGTGDKNNTADTHADDAALNELLGGTPGKDATLTALDNALKADNATADSINKALDAAKRQNEINEANAKNAGIAKLEAKKAELDAAYNSLTEDQKKSAKEKYDAAITAITNAESAVNKATKPSQIKNALNIDATIKDAKDAINTQVSTTQKGNSSNQNTENQSELEKEKKAQEKRINDSDLPDAEKQKAIDDIKAATKSGDPTAIANRYLKAKKIADALDKLDKEFKHLNNAQRDAFKAIINGTDAGNHTNDDGTTSDDIDDALANAAKTDTAMARLETLKQTADTFANGEKYKALQDGDAKKKAFNTASTAAGAVLDKAKGDAKNADQVNDLYKDLLKAMQAIDKDAKGAGVNTDALKNEIDSDNKLKPNTTSDPKTTGDSVYTTASQAKKDAFDQALNEAQTALNNAKNADVSTAENEATAQKAIDDALDKLIRARLALDGVNTKPLEQQIAKDADIKANVRYTNADTDKKQAYDKALKDAQDLIKNLTTPITAGASTPQYGNITLDSKENKQKALDEALAKLKAAEKALNGKEPTPTPTPTPAAVDKTALAAEIALDSTIGRRMSYIVSPSDKQLAYDRALSKARAVYADPSATQDDVNAAVEALRAAARALSGYGSVDNDVNPLPSPLPTPVPGDHEDSGFGVNDNAPTTVDKGELNVQIDSAEADSQPGNAGAGNNNAGNNNAGNANANAANANANSANANNNANGANSAAVNAAVENSPAVKQADAQVAKAQAALDSALAEAKKVAADPNATQAQVDAAAQKLSAARKALAEAKAHAAQVRASVRAQVLKSGVSQLSKTGSNVSVIGLLATVAAAGAAFFVAKRRGTSRHSNN